MEQNRRYLEAARGLGTIAVLPFDECQHMERVELLLVALQHELVEKFGLRDISRLVRGNGARKHTLRVGDRRRHYGVRF